MFAIRYFIKKPYQVGQNRGVAFAFMLITGLSYLSILTFFYQAERKKGKIIRPYPFPSTTFVFGLLVRSGQEPRNTTKIINFI
jgi:hypothetical protein